MRINTTLRGVRLDDRTSELLTKKINKLDKYFGDEADAKLTLTQEKGRQKLEITIPYKGFTLRAERAGDDLTYAIDEVIEALERQIRKYRTRLEKRAKSAGVDNLVMDMADDSEDELPKVVRTKRFSIKPMDVEEAIMQMELVEHNFFVFTNADTNQINILYRRGDGNLGLIEPDTMG